MAKRKSSKPASQGKSSSGYVSGEYKTPGVSDYVVVELKHEAPVTFSAAGFSAPAAGEATASGLNKVLEGFSIETVQSHFGLPQRAIDRRVTPAASMRPAPTAASLVKQGLDAEFFHSGFVQVVPKSEKDADKIVTALKKQDAVWDAYVAPRPVPAAVKIERGASTGSRNFEPSQGYLHSAPDGISAMEVWDQAGTKGEKITICDIEGAWNLAHEDLPRGISLIGGTMIPDLGWRDHGTAVLGEMVAQPNAFGAVGIAHKAKAVVQSAVIGGVFNAAAAITNAAASLKAGDVILIELHAPSPITGKFIAMQFWSDIFSAIVAATQKGITVVEAAGNGNEDFDQAIYNSSGLQKDSGAIVVGAGIPPTNFFDIEGFGSSFPGYSRIGVPRSRIFFSNYGKIVNVQAWGWHVTTLGYGDAQGGPSENNWYTLRFSGTSSASPIVTGAVASIQGRAKAVTGAPLTPANVRKLLIKTGTPQVAGPGVPLTQKIGPQPNLLKAIPSIV
jgi:subtilisin family serine protease